MYKNEILNQLSNAEYCLCMAECLKAPEKVKKQYRNKASEILNELIKEFKKIN